MEVKFIRIEDFEGQRALEALAHEIWNEYFPPIIGQAQVDYMLEKFSSLEAIQRQTQEGYQYYFITQSGETAGYLTIKIDGDELFLSKLYIKAEHRGSGLGRLAMQFIRRQAENSASKYIRLTVNRDNASSIKAYEKMGFKTIEEKVMDIGSGFVMDDFIMRLEL